MNIENQNVEYKESWRDEYLKWICGFANAQGGKICVGVDDEGFVVGLDEKEAHRLSEEIQLYSGPAIQMRIYADRIELWNDGELPEGYTAETLWGKHSSKPRNHNIADVFYKAGFIESWGRGFKKIREGFEKAGMKLPVFEPHCGGVLVTIFRKEMTIDPLVPHQYPTSTP